MLSNPAFELRRAKTGKEKSLIDQGLAQSLPPPRTETVTTSENLSERFPQAAVPPGTPVASGPIASGEVGKARDILAAIRTLKALEQDQRPATDAEKAVLKRFAGFGPVALSIFPNPATG